MCITINPAHLNDTVVTSAQNQAGVNTTIYKCSVSSKGKNALAVWIPTDEPFTAENLLDLSEAPSLNGLLKKTYDETMREMSRGGSKGGSSLSFSVTFQIVGNWATVIAPAGSSVEEIRQVLNTVDEAYRPTATDEVLEALVKLRYPILLGCHKPTRGDMDDFGYYYVPRNPDEIMVPMLDGHGEAPENDDVLRDHLIFVSCPDINSSRQLMKADVTSYLKSAPEMEEYLPVITTATGTKELILQPAEITGYSPNGDTFFSVKELTSSKVNHHRCEFPESLKEECKNPFRFPEAL